MKYESIEFIYVERGKVVHFTAHDFFILTIFINLYKNATAHEANKFQQKVYWFFFLSVWGGLIERLFLSFQL